MYSSKPNVIALCHTFCMRQMQDTFLKCEQSLPEEDYIYIHHYRSHGTSSPHSSFAFKLRTPLFCIQIDGGSFVCAPQCEVAVLSAKG